MTSARSSNTLLVDGVPRDLDWADGKRAVRHEARACLAAAFSEKFAEYSDSPCLGWRPTGHSFEWMSYGQLWAKSRQVGRALSSKLPPGAMVGICGANSASWFVADFGCLWAGLASVPLSEGWDRQVLQLVLEKCDVVAVLCDADQVPKLRAALGQKLWIVAFESEVQADCALSDLYTGNWPDQPVVERTADMPHTILHTSGTTGLPKGVIYTDGLWLRNMVTYEEQLGVGYSYMPLAFITDRHTVYTAVWNGGRIGIRTPGKTHEIFRDLQDVRPTVFKGVPTFFERVHSAAHLVHDGSLALLGGRCHTLICGAGALSEDTAKFFRSCEVGGKPVQFLEMYGGTECGNLAVNRRLLDHVEYKLLPVDGLPADSGELVVKTGSKMFAGYHKDPERTEAAFTEDGYYKIGDLVRLGPTNRRVDVIGRAKSSLKLGNGKWVFPESLEDLYRSRLHAQGLRYILVHGDCQHDFLVAVVDAAESAMPRMLQLLHDIAADEGRPAHEHIASVIPASEPFSCERQTVNGTGKLHRQNLMRTYRAVIDGQMQRLAEEAARTPLRRLDAQKSFAEQGGTSLQAVRIASLYAELGVPISHVAKLLLQSNQPVKQVLESLSAADPTVDVEALELTVITLRSGDGGDKTTLLTGATGFVGRFVLAELLSRGRRVISLVRARDEVERKNRLRAALVEIGRWKGEWWQDLDVVIGSLGPKLTLGQLQVGTVIHAAAFVDLQGCYEVHRRANVLGTRDVLQLAASLGARVLFVSSTDTYPSREHAVACRTEPAPAVLANTKHGYAASKAVGEAMVASSIRQGLSACTVRLGMVGGDTRTGFCNPTDCAMRLIIGFSHAQAFPETDERHTMINSLPVDVVAAALVELADSAAVGAVNLVSGAPLLPMAELREQLLRFRGFEAFKELPILPFPEFMARLCAEAQLSAWPVLGFATTHKEFPEYNSRCPPLGATAEWLQPKTLDALQRGQDEHCLHKMLHFTFGTK